MLKKLEEKLEDVVFYLFAFLFIYIGMTFLVRIAGMNHVISFLLAFGVWVTVYVALIIYRVTGKALNEGWERKKPKDSTANLREQIEDAGLVVLKDHGIEYGPRPDGRRGEGPNTV